MRQLVTKGINWVAPECGRRQKWIAGVVNIAALDIGKTNPNESALGAFWHGWSPVKYKRGKQAPFFFLHGFYGGIFQLLGRESE